MQRCQLCRSEEIEIVLDLGKHVCSSTLLDRQDEELQASDIALGVCRACGLIQLMNPWPYRLLVPKYDWVVYREPEGHLDTLVDGLIEHCGLGPASIVAGVSLKDDTTLRRFADRGIGRTWRLDMATHLRVRADRAGPETLQHVLAADVLRATIDAADHADLVVVRHLLEHAEDLHRFLAAVSSMVRDGGHVVIEVPDCVASLKRQDYTMLWEEHTVYLTARTLALVLDDHGFETVDLHQYPYRYENSLVLIARKTGTPTADRYRIDAEEHRLALEYGREFGSWTRRYQELFAGHAARGGIAFYGAGHLTASFIAYHGLAELTRFVVDDTPQKAGKYMPGTRVPIVGRSMLAGSDVGLCLLGLSPESEDRVIAANGDFTGRGGIFRSILPGSARAIQSQLP